MGHFVYLAILAGCLLAPIVLELTLRVAIVRRWRRLLTTLVPVVVIFGLWDTFAVRAGQWTYVRRWITGVRLPGGLPIEELLFFLVIPTCAVATFEAVRRRRPDWPLRDQP